MEFVEDTEELDLCFEKTGVDFLFSYFMFAGSRLSLFSDSFSVSFRSSSMNLYRVEVRVKLQIL